ncbi:MAG: hypothetical protein HQL90_16035 [Magnetococcales bacterium]|nr:hypothetical protein [Magnetococcales bacterium]
MGRRRAVTGDVMLSEEETKRMELLAQFAQRDSRLAMIQKGADRYRRHLLAAIRPGEVVDVVGVQIDGEQAGRLVGSGVG